MNKHIKIRAIFVVSLFIVVSMFACDVIMAKGDPAPDIYSRFKKPMPELALMSDYDFISATKPITKKPYGDETLFFSMRIDKTWDEGIDRSSSNFIMNEKLFLEISSYFSKPTIAGRSRIEIEALNIDSNLTAEQWYIKYILESGYTTEGMVTHNPNKIESLIVIMEKDYSYYLRTLAYINGSRVILVKYYVPTHYIQEQAVMQAMVLATFKLTHNKERVQKEMKPYRILDIVEFRYPEDWKIYVKDVRSVDRLAASIFNTVDGVDMSGRENNSSIDGKVDILVISSVVGDTLIEEIAEYKKGVEAKGMLVGEKLVENYEFKYSDDMDFAITEVYRGIDSTNNLSEYEFWFSVLVGGNYYYIVMLLTPSRNEMFGVWAENTESYKIMLTKVKPMVGAFLQRE